MRCFSIPFVIIVALCTGSVAQESESTKGTTSGSHTQDTRSALLNKSLQCQKAIHKAEAAHADNQEKARLYYDLGTLYEGLGWNQKAEAAFGQAIALLDHRSSNELAESWEHLSIVHLLMGNDHEAEKDELAALRVREDVGDPIGLALTWIDLADFYYHRHRFAMALDYAQRAMSVLADNPKASVDARIAVRQALGYALCGNGRCGEAIPLLKEGLELAKANFGADSLNVGAETYALGFVAWQNHDMPDAAQWMKQGIERLKVDLGWGDVLYVQALRQYEQFLVQNKEPDRANLVDRELRALATTVDVRSFPNANTDANGGSIASGLR